MRVSVAASILIAIVLALFVLRPAPLADLDEETGDLLSRLAGPGSPSGSVAIVAIDEQSLRELGRWPWPRATIGRLSRAALDAGAVTVALDMMFPQEDPEGDQSLAEDLAGRPIVSGYAFTFEGSPAQPANCSIPPLSLALVSSGGLRNGLYFRATGAVCNTSLIASAGAASGFLNASPDHDGILRRVPVIVEYKNRQYPSLALATVNAYRRESTTQLITDSAGLWRLRLNGRSAPLEPESLLRLRFRGGPRRFRYVRAAEVLAGAIPPDTLRGKIVVVGGVAAGMDDMVLTPAASLLPAVEAQATAIDNLLTGDSFYKVEGSRWWELALGALIGVVLVLVIARAGLRWGTIAAVAMIAGAWAACVLLSAAAGVLFSPLPATAVLGGALPLALVVQYLEDRKGAANTQRILIDELRRAQTVLETSEQRYRRLVENVNDAIIMDDVDGRLLFANRRFREWFGIAPGSEIGLALDNYVAPEWRAEVRDRHDRRMRGEPAADHFEFEGIRSDGSRISIEALATAVEENGRIVGSQAALRDTTERRRMEAQYLQAQKMDTVGRLAGGVAHDFNNLLTVINGYSAMLLDRIKSDDPARGYADEISKAGGKAADLTEKLLSFSRKQKAYLRPLNLNLLVTDAKRMFERVIGEDVRLETSLDAGLADVVADPGQMHQVLMNLVVNARDAMPKGGELTIETKNVSGEAGEAEVCLSVSDTGTGLTEEVKQHLFEPFFTTKEQGKGTGLGLATVYGIVKQSGGRIEVTSARGYGARFQIYLPGRSPRTTPEPAAPLQTPSRGSETLLLVEDQDAVREFGSTILRELGYKVMEASNGPDALALAERFSSPIQLLIADIVLPVMDGRALAEKLRSIHPETHVLYMSGYSQERIGGTSADDRWPMLRKPFTAAALASSVRRALGGEQNWTVV